MKKNKKINIFFDAFPLVTERTSGIGHLIAETIRALDQNKTFQKKYQHVLIAPLSGMKYLGRWGFKNTIHVPIRVKGRIWSALVLYRLLPPADLFFGRGIYVFGNYTTWPLLFSKSVTYIHDLNFIENPDTVKPKTLKVLQKNIPLWIQRSEVIATISEFSKKEIIKHYGVPEHKVKVIYCGVNTDTFYPRSQKSIRAIKQKYGITKKYMLFLSNIEPRKNILRVLDAYEKLTADVELVLIGADGWLNDEVVKKIESLNNSRKKVIWPKEFVPDEDIPSLLSGAELLVHPALYEGFGIPPLEALACGTPVVLSNTTSLPEVAGDVGVYVDPLNTADIVDKIEKTLTSPKQDEKLIQRAKLFSWSDAGDSLMNLINSLVK